jgi:sarcosine oxidase subunit gamma
MSTPDTQPLPALANLSRCDRFGVKGKGAPSWLSSMGVQLPSRPNRLIEGDDGLIVARYGETEFAFANFHRPASRTVDELRQALERGRPEGCYSVPRADSQAAFGVAGEAALRVLAAVCPADLRARAFGPGDVLQTLCAGVSAQLWNLSQDDATRVVVLCDSSVARHQWAALHHAITVAGESAERHRDWVAAASTTQ